MERMESNISILINKKKTNIVLSKNNNFSID